MTDNFLPEKTAIYFNCNI